MTRGLRISAMLRGRSLVHIGTKVKRSNNLALEDGTGLVSLNVGKPNHKPTQRRIPENDATAVLDVVPPFLCTEHKLKRAPVCACASAYACACVFIYSFASTL